MLIAAGVIVGVVVLVSVLGDDGGTEKEPAPTLRTASIPALGLRFTAPASWQRSISARVLRLRSPDGSLVMTFASPIAGRAPERAKDLLVSTVKRSLAGVRVIDEGTGQLGGRRVRSVELSGLDHGRAVRVLGVVDSTPYRTYAVTVLTPARPSRKALQAARTILNSVRLSKPVPTER